MHYLRIAICVALLALACPLPGRAGDKGAATSPMQQRADKIKANGAYYYGEGRGSTDDEAERIALDDLSRKISMTVRGDTRGVTTQDDETFTSNTSISTFATLVNTDKITISREPQASVLIYVLKADVNQGIAARADKIRELAANALSLERKLEIGSALKYYNWALALARVHQSPISFDISGNKGSDLKTWLHSKVTSVLGNIKVALDNVEERPGEVDPIVVNLLLTYEGQPVADLDYAYYNGEIKVRDQHARNGHASLPMERLPKDNVQIIVDYLYQDEGRLFDPELAAIYDSGAKAATFRQATLNIPCKGADPQKFAVKEPKLPKEERQELETAMAQAPPTVAKERNTVPVKRADDASALIQRMTRIKDAIASRQYTSVKDLFTPEGYSLFMRMMGSGTVKVTKSGPQMTAEFAGTYTLGKYIPVAVTYRGGHTVTEDLVLRFDRQGLVESVAYALSKRAQDDIFRQNAWSMEARYAILHFMEDYQTAFALKRLDYIKQIFADDAVIIRGTRAAARPAKKTRRGRDGKGSSYYIPSEQFNYKTETKDQYIRALEQQFPQKRYIKLTFEDNEIKEAPGLYNNIFWIEIKQYYDSNNYNDVGYLTLMIDMRETDPQIKVRTWTPGRLGLQTIMERYTQE